MPAYLLEPVPDMAWHADWCASDHQVECVVIAEDEQHARRLAADRFRTPLPDPALSDPWIQSDLVQVKTLDGRKVPRVPLGTVIPFLGIKLSER